jgi:hypothetical protein
MMIFIQYLNRIVQTQYEHFLMKQKNFSTEDIAEITGLDIEQIKFL